VEPRFWTGRCAERAAEEFARVDATYLQNRQLRLPNDPELLDELANVRLRETSPGVLRMDHDPDQHDDRAIALALATHNLLDRSGRGCFGVGPRVF
jgi:phage FluMu gp28-like protein